MRTPEEIKKEHFKGYLDCSSAETATMVSTRFALEVLLNIQELLEELVRRTPTV